MCARNLPQALTTLTHRSPRAARYKPLPPARFDPSHPPTRPVSTPRPAVLSHTAVRLYPLTAHQHRRSPFQSGEGCSGSGGTRASSDNSCDGDRVGGANIRASGVSSCSVGVGDGDSSGGRNRTANTFLSVYLQS